MTQEVWDIYPEVYHYTSFSSALLIIHSATLRATRFDSLNDTQEIVYAKKLLAKKHHEKFPEDPLSDVMQWIESALKKTFQNYFLVYITSFCGVHHNERPHHQINGLLSMWRSYGIDGSCAIEFKTKNIYEFGKKYSSNLILDQAIYEEKNDNEPSYIQSLNNFETLFHGLLANSQNGPEGKLSDLGKELLCLSIRTKHPAFFEEREVRLGFVFGTQTQENINESGPPAKFHSIPFSPDKDISRIIIGPHRNQQERYEFLKSYLSKFGLENIEVTKSEIPLRT